MTEGRINLWGKTRDAFTHVYNHYLESADFFLKADDDTYVIVENLLHLLQPYDPNETLYLGCEFKGYMSGGAGALTKHFETCYRYISEIELM